MILQTFIDYLIIFSFLLLIILLLMFFLKKHTRTPSQIEISEFKALTKIDALQSLKKELNKLLLTAPSSQAENITAEFAGFERLFARYLTDVNAEIKWQNIEPLPKEAV